MSSACRAIPGAIPTSTSIPACTASWTFSAWAPTARRAERAAMPTSVRGSSNGRGFTLIELLVVLLIMGIMAGMIGAIVRPDDRALLRVEAERLAQLLELAATESRLTG